VLYSLLSRSGKLKTERSWDCEVRLPKSDMVAGKRGIIRLIGQETKMDEEKLAETINMDVYFDYI